MGSPLFEVRGKTLVPTKATELIYQASYEMQRAFVHFERALDSVRGGERRLRCGMVAGIHDAYTREEFAAPHAMATAKHCTYVTTDCNTLRSMLKAGELDVAYVLGPQPTCEGFVTRFNRQGRLFLMVNRESPLARKATVRLDDLRGMPFVSQGPGYDLHTFIEGECRKLGFSLDTIYTSPSFFDITWQVNDNFGVSYCLASSITQYDAPNVVCVPFEEPQMC